jgi:hypothetical protein
MEITTAAQIPESINSSVLGLSSNDSIPQSELLKEALRIQESAREQVRKEIALTKAMGNPIYYSENGKLIRENADGRRFYCEALPDGTDQILGEIQ